MKRILLLTDFSDTARHAVMYALKMFESSNMDYYLLNAYELEFSGTPYVTQVKEEWATESLKGLKSELSIIHHRYPQARVELLSVFGTLIDAVKHEVTKHTYDLLVLGCKGETALENFLLGSRAYDVIKHIPTPVFLVPRHAKFKYPEKIVFATDLHDFPSDKTIEPVRDMVHMFHSPLVFVNVLDEDVADRVESEDLIAKHFPGVNVSFNFVEDDTVSDGINKFVEENDAQIITLVRHQMGRFDRFFHPSVTRQMVLHPEHPMLILHDV